MVKKLFLSAVTVGALATSAMAYNVNELSKMTSGNSMSSAVLNNSSQLYTNFRGSTLKFNQAMKSNALIFPAYFAGNGWETTLRVINTNPKQGIVAKVVFFDGTDSHELRDFNIYLSPNDVWVGKVKIGSDGNPKVISTDDSAPLENGNMASVDNPLSKEISSKKGYVEVIAMAATDQSVSTYKNGHGDHVGLRKAYKIFANRVRTGNDNPSLVFTDGVIQNNKATLPYVKISNTALTGEDIDNDGKVDYNLTGVNTASLTGDVRITDTINGKDMDLPAYKVDYASGTNTSLVYLEGEKANLADVEINETGAGKFYYDRASLETDINNTSSNVAYVTYGNAPVNDMYAILTNPFKRIYVQAALDEKDGLDGSIAKNQIMPSVATYYKDASTDANKVINYGSTSLIAQIYDESENLMSASQFSPATTPTIKLTDEVAATGVDVNDKNTLAYYLNEAVNKGYKAGFVKLTNANGSTLVIPGIMTQMLATTAGGKVVTNWIIPQQ